MNAKWYDIDYPCIIQLSAYIILNFVFPWQIKIDKQKIIVFAITLLKETNILIAKAYLFQNTTGSILLCVRKYVIVNILNTPFSYTYSEAIAVYLDTKIWLNCELIIL